MDIITLTLFIFGFGLLIIGAELLVRGASNLALVMGITPLVIGLTVVAFGTSAPEIAINLQAALGEQSDLAIGNVVGSNILNILLILGIAALIAPIKVSQRLIRLDVPIMIGASCLLLIFALDGGLSTWEGLIFIILMISYTSFSIIKGRPRPVQLPSEEVTEEQEIIPTALPSNKTYAIPLQIIFIIVGLGLLVQGSRWLVFGGVAIAEYFGISQLIIGLTILAIGTSLPEIATVVVASLRGKQELIVGNVVGSNLFNILLVLGLSSLIAPQVIEVSPAALAFDIPIMVAVAVVCLPIFFTDNLIERWEGGLFVAYYLVYTLYLIFNATHHHYLQAFNATMLGFVIPLTLLALSVSVWQTIMKKYHQTRD